MTIPPAFVCIRGTNASQGQPLFFLWQVNPQTLDGLIADCKYLEGQGHKTLGNHIRSNELFVTTFLTEGLTKAVDDLTVCTLPTDFSTIVPPIQSISAGGVQVTIHSKGLVLRAELDKDRATSVNLTLEMLERVKLWHKVVRRPAPVMALLVSGDQPASRPCQYLAVLLQPKLLQVLDEYFIVLGTTREFEPNIELNVSTEFATLVSDRSWFDLPQKWWGLVPEELFKESRVIPRAGGDEWHTLRLRFNPTTLEQRLFQFEISQKISFTSRWLSLNEVLKAVDDYQAAAPKFGCLDLTNPLQELKPWLTAAGEVAL